MTNEYKNEVANVELKNWELLDVVSRDPQFGDGVISTLNEQDESHEWEEIERRPCTVVKALPNQIILKPDSLQPGEDNRLTITEAYDGRDYSKFYVGQKVLHITYEKKQPVNEEQEKNIRKFYYKAKLESAINNLYYSNEVGGKKIKESQEENLKQLNTIRENLKNMGDVVGQLTEAEKEQVEKELDLAILSGNINEIGTARRKRKYLYMPGRTDEEIYLDERVHSFIGAGGILKDNEELPENLKYIIDYNYVTIPK